MRILITGSTGTVGSYLTNYLSSKNHTIRAHYRKETNRKALSIKESSIEWTKGDLYDFGYLETVFQDIDLVIHCAALIDFSGNTKDLFKSNVELTTRIVDQCIESHTKLIFISSTAALGKKKDSNEVNEDNHQYDLEFYNAYGQSKKLAEMEVWRGVAEGLDATILNPGFVLAKEHKNKGIKKVYKTVQSNFINMAPDGIMPYVDIEDIAIAVSNTIDQNLFNEQFLLVGGAISYTELFKIIKPNANFTSVPFGFMYLIAMIISFFAAVFKKKPVLTTSHIRFSYQKLTFDNQKSINRLHLQYKNINRSISEYCK